MASLDVALDAALGFGTPVTKPSPKKAMSLADALDAALATPGHQPPAEPSYLKKLSGLVTEGLPAAGKAFVASQTAPTMGETLREEAQRPDTKAPAISKALYGKSGVAGHLADLAERFLRLPGSFGKAVAELGPDQAKALTEALAANLPFLGRPGGSALATDVRSLYQRPTLPQPPRRLPTPLLALPPHPHEMPPSGVIPPQPQRVNPPRPSNLEPVPTLPGGPPRLGDDALKIPPRVTPPAVKLPTAEEIAARRAGIDTTQPAERPLTILDQHGQPILVERKGWKPSTGAPEPPAPLPPSLPPLAPLRPAQTPSGVGATAVQRIKDRSAARATAGLEAQAREYRQQLVNKATPEEVALLDAQAPKSADQALAFWREQATKPKAEPVVAKPPEPIPPPAPPRLAPVSEPTVHGEQGLIGGTPAREMPKGPSRTTVKQADLTDTPLFGQEKAARAAESDAAQGSLLGGEAAAPKARTYAGQHYGKTVSPETVTLSDPEEVRIMVRDAGGFDPDSLRAAGVSLEDVPKEMVKPGGQKFDELVQHIAEAQSRRPKDVERELSRTLSKYGVMRQSLTKEGLLTEIRAGKPPSDVGIELSDWQGMGPSERRSTIEFFRATWEDESGRLDLGKFAEAWKRFRQKFPMEEAVRTRRPESRVISEVERWGVGVADGLKSIAEQRWWKGVKDGRMPWEWSGGIRRMDPERLKAIEEQMVRLWREGGQTPEARAAAIRTAPDDVRAWMLHRESQIAREQASRAYFGLDRIPETRGPYIPRRVKAEESNHYALESERLGVGKVPGHEFEATQTGIGPHGKKRQFETYREGEQAGVVYDDPRNAILLREWESLKLRATHRLFKNLEGNTLFRNQGEAMAASPTGKAWRVDNAPGGTWWVTSEEELRFLQQNLRESAQGFGRTGGLLHYANSFLRNPNLVNPSPHLTKNMWVKAILARGPQGLVTVPRDMVEYARGLNPALKAEFEQAMPFSKSGQIGGEILGHELVRGPVGTAIRTAEDALGMLNKGSSRVIFEWGDPAMRYSLFKHYRGKGMAPYEAANHAWTDLIRYGTRSDVTDFWKSVPLNFFVPWRFGTFSALTKQVTNHPVRTALLIGGIDYLREMRYRTAGKWTHLPWDYVTAPIAQLAQSKDGTDFAKNAGSQAALTALFGPGGAFGASQIDDMLRLITLKATPQDQARMKNMFWGLSQLYNLPDEYAKGDYAGMMMTILLGEHSALSHQPRRLFRTLPESVPGLGKSPVVDAAERMQEQGEAMRDRRDKARAAHPSKSIEDKLRAAGHLK